MKTLSLILSMFFLSQAQAANILSYQSNSASDGISKVYILPDRIRTEYRSHKTDFALIYRADKHLTWLLDLDKRNAIETREENLTSAPAVREPMVPQRSFFGNISHRATGQREKVNTWECQTFERLDNKKLSAKFCAVDIGVVGLEKDSAEALKKMESVYHLFKNQPLADVLTWDKKWLSVRIESGMNEDHQNVSELKTVEQVSTVSGDLFEIPRDFPKFNLRDGIDRKSNHR